MAFVLGSVNFSECFNISGDKLILITLQTVLKHVLIKYNIFFLIILIFKWYYNCN